MNSADKYDRVAEVNYYNSGHTLPLFGNSELHIYYKYNTGLPEDYQTAKFSVEEICEFVGQEFDTSKYFRKHGIEVYSGFVQVGGLTFYKEFVSYIGLLEVLFDNRFFNIRTVYNSKIFWKAFWDKEVIGK